MASTQWLKPINTRRNANAETKLEEEEPLTPGARLFHAPQFNCCIIAVIGCKTKINADVIKEGLKHTLIKHPRFSSNLVLDPKKAGKPTGWIRTQVNMDDHVIIPDFNPNMDSPDQFLEDYVSNITKTPMDLSKPLWEIHLLNIKTREANSVAVFRIHHSIGDGISLMSLVLACTRQTANPDALPTLPIDTNKKKKKRKITSLSSSLGFLSCFFGLMFIFKLLWYTLIDLVMFMATSLWLKDTKTPVKGGPGVGSTPKRFVYRIVSLDDIKLVKKALDVTINDVILGITQAGLSSYLNRKYGEIKGEEEAREENLPKHIRLRTTFLVNLRQTSTIEDLAEKMESSTKGRWNWGNSIGYIMFPFHIAIRDDPLDHIRNAKATIDKKKLSLEAICTYIIAKIVLKILGLRVLAALAHRVLSHATLSFSNIVGPKEEISFYGHPIVFIAPSVYGHPQALTVHFQSYMDKMTFVLAVDQDVISDPQRLCDDIEESLRLANKAIVEQKLIKS
ncbi:wax ester synthase/diacylglycerol acyltransferase 5-like [Silene latifolia]|uniref:wax ester synthase/diacylglycerol acyltransferase 5-like n=1 Tax=Silene latifolia TaxID=37657 RepID=UPI003D77A880